MTAASTYRVLALLDVLLRRAALVVEGDDALSWPRQVGHDEADARVKLTRMPLDLRYDTARLFPALRLIAEAGVVAAHLPESFFESFFETFKEEFGQDITDLWDADDVSLANFTQSLHRDVRTVRHSRGTPRHVNVYGYLYDIETGELHLVEDSRGDPNAPRGAAWR